MTPAGAGGRPGGSAEAEYRRRRARELARQAKGAPWRLALVAAAAVVGTGLAADAALSRPWLTGLAAGACMAWALRLRPSRTTRAWRDRVVGERATARRLRQLERDGFQVLHDLVLPGTLVSVDHVVIGPSGLFVIGSKRYRGSLRQTPDGMLWHGRYPLAQPLATLWLEAQLLGDTLDLGPHVPITPLMVIHRAVVPWGGVIVAGIPVIGPEALSDILHHEPVLGDQEVWWLADKARRLLGSAN